MDEELQLKPRDESSKCCPMCSDELAADAVLCTNCGFNLQTGMKAALLAKGGPELEVEATQSVGMTGWLSLLGGAVAAGVFACFEFLNFIATYLVILVHECGHTVVGWILGFPTLPAFDFTHGGGVAMRFTDKPKLYLFVIMYSFLGWLVWVNRKRIIGVIVAIILLIGYAAVAHTGLNITMITFMGHGFELVVATVFLYKAFSGSMVHEGERPVYAFCGIYVIIADLRFAHNLIFDPGFQLRYRNHPAGHTNDFIKIAEALGVSVTAVAAFFLCLCFLPPVISFLAHRYRRLW